MHTAHLAGTLWRELHSAVQCSGDTYSACGCDRLTALLRSYVTLLCHYSTILVRTSAVSLHSASNLRLCTLRSNTLRLNVAGMTGDTFCVCIGVCVGGEEEEGWCCGGRDGRDMQELSGLGV